MTNTDKALAIKALLVQMAVDDKLPTDMTLLDESIFMPILDENDKEETKVSMSIGELRNLFVAGREFGEEYCAVQEGWIEEDKAIAPDFGDYMLDAHNINVEETK